MNGGGILQSLIKGFTNKYGDDITRDAFAHYGDDVMKKGSNSFLAKELAGTGNTPKMVSYHGISEDKLTEALNKMDGNLVNPSIQSVDPFKNMGGDFGEIILLGNKKLVNSNSPNVSTFNRDVYSPRFPKIDDEGNIAFSNTFATPRSVSEHMNKQGMKGAEEIFDNMELSPGVIAAKNAKKLGTVRDIVQSQSNIQPYKTVKGEIQQYENNLFDMVDDIYNKNSENVDWDIVTGDINSLLNNQRVSPSIDPDSIAQVNTFKKNISKLPTDYFETKVTRPVKLNEFTGAILPDDFANPEILAALEKYGVPIVDRYDMKARINNGDQNAALQESLKRLTKQDRFKTPYLLGTAGAIPTAGILGSLLGNNEQERMA